MRSSTGLLVCIATSKGARSTILIIGAKSGLFFVKWLHTIEKLRRHDTLIDASETVILDDTRHTFVENDLIDSDSKSLAAQISRHLANNLDDTWSWAITARFGYIFRELATMCELDCE